MYKSIFIIKDFLLNTKLSYFQYLILTLQSRVSFIPKDQHSEDSLLSIVNISTYHVFVYSNKISTCYRTDFSQLS